MKYMGSKSRIAKDIVPIIQKCIDDNNLSYYLEPFVGGGNVIDKIKCRYKKGCDKNKYIIALLDYVSKDGQLLSEVPRELYNEVRTKYQQGENDLEDWFVANVGFLASYNGRWFDGGYAKAGFEKTPRGLRFRDYYQESKHNLEAQAIYLKDINFKCCDYRDIDIPKGIMIYCDPPYEGTKQFAISHNFDYKEFWEIMRQWSKNNYVIISELKAPDDFVCIWSKDVQRSMKSTDNTMRAVEKLFTYKDGLYLKENICGQN